jgi:hypothetical protein
MFGGNGGLLGFIIGNPKYFEGRGGHGGHGVPGGSKLPPFGSNGYPTKSCPPFRVFLYAH